MQPAVPLVLCYHISVLACLEARHIRLADGFGTSRQHRSRSTSQGSAHASGYPPGATVCGRRPRAQSTSRARATEFSHLDPQAIFERWAEFVCLGRRPRADRHQRGRFAVRRVRPLRAGANAPRQVFAIGLNYREHAAEAGLALARGSTRWSSQSFPPRSPAPEQWCELPSRAVDYEAELVVVIGRPSAPRQQGGRVVSRCGAHPGPGSVRARSAVPRPHPPVLPREVLPGVLADRPGARDPG